MKIKDGRRPPQIEAQRSGFDLERRSSAMSELSAQLEARDMELAPTRGRTGFDGGTEAGIASGCA